MKTKKVKILLCVITLFACIQFIRYMNPPFKTECNEFSIYNGDKVELKVKSLLNREYEYTIYNHTSDELYCGNMYELQVKKGTNWETVFQNHVGFTQEMITIPINSSWLWRADLNHIYGNLPIGKYRIVKDVETTEGLLHVAGEFRVLF